MPMPGKTRRGALRVNAGPALLASVLVCTLVLAGCPGGGDETAAPRSASGSSQPPPPISITPSSLPQGQVGHAYAATVTAIGGKAPLSWSVTSGALPAGLTLA